jgi:hypothetical protein
MLALWLAAAAAPAAAAPTAPPPLAPSFSIRFRETFTGFPAPPTSGAWFYDFPRRLWRADHDAPQSNNFCACALNTTDSCSLLFTPAGLYVDYKDHPQNCCRLCGAAEGCTALSPSWLANGSLVGTTEDGCSEYCEPGDEATADCMSFPPSGRNPPCKYLEHFSFGATTITHNLTFEAQTYVEGPQDPAHFAVRSQCAQPCPNLFPATCG